MLGTAGSARLEPSISQSGTSTHISIEDQVASDTDFSASLALNVSADQRDAARFRRPTSTVSNAHIPTNLSPPTSSIPVHLNVSTSNDSDVAGSSSIPIESVDITESTEEDTDPHEAESGENGRHAPNSASSVPSSPIKLTGYRIFNMILAVQFGMLKMVLNGRGDTPEYETVGWVVSGSMMLCSIWLRYYAKDHPGELRWLFKEDYYPVLRPWVGVLRQLCFTTMITFTVFGCCIPITGRILVVVNDRMRVIRHSSLDDANTEFVIDVLLGSGIHMAVLVIFVVSAFLGWQACQRSSTFRTVTHAVAFLFQDQCPCLGLNYRHWRWIRLIWLRCMIYVLHCTTVIYIMLVASRFFIYKLAW